MYVLATQRTQSVLKHYVAYDRQVDSLNRMLPKEQQLYIVCGETNIKDPTPWLNRDTTSAVSGWLSAICQWKEDAADVPLQTSHLLDNLTRAIQHGPANPYLYYNRAYAHVQCMEYEQALADYSRAIELDPNLAEAYYNRGLVRLAHKQQELAISDLSKAGELGLYTAYSIIKRVRK